MTSIDIKVGSKSEWVEMFPFGVAMGANNIRPVMIFKDKNEKRVLPVWLSPMDAGIAVTQSNTPYQNQSATKVVGSPHEIAWKILGEVGIGLEKCLFKRVTHNQQYVELHFKSEDSDNNIPKKIIEAKADDAISFCMRSGCKFFATVKYIESSRVLEGEVLAGSMMNRSVQNPHKYLN